MLRVKGFRVSALGPLTLNLSGFKMFGVYLVSSQNYCPFSGTKYEGAGPKFGEVTV